MIPQAFLEAYDSARKGAGLIERSGRGRIAVSGRDRASYLHGLLTNDITALKPGQGCYAAYLTPQGRMITDLWVYELGDVILITVGLAQKDTLLSKLDQFLFSEDVQLGDTTETFVSVTIVGPDSARMMGGVLGNVSAEELWALGEHGNRRTQFESRPAIVLSVSDTGEPGFDILVDASQREALAAALRRAGAQDVDLAAAEAIRIEAGVPLFGRDMDEDTIPLEAGIESRAISLTKGCYVGQEVIIRVLHRGHGRVARKLAGLTLAGEIVPPDGAVVEAGDRDVGRTTSSSFSPALNQPIALAYLHRDFIAPGTQVSVNGVDAVVAPLPFVAKNVSSDTAGMSV
jgi:tRNA-modifying protein YgfZ